MAPLGVPSSAWAQAPYDNLAVQALRNNYSLFQSGQAVDGAWGNFSSYDAYILEQAGADVQNWIYDNNSFKSGVVSLIDNTLGNEATTSKASSKRVAQDYLAAKSLGETAKATQLLVILQARQIAAGNGSFDNNAFSDVAAFEMLGRAGDIDEINTSGAITYLLGEQDASGAWTGSWQDIMTTCEALRVLKYLQPYAGDQATAVGNAIDQGGTWLKARQQNNGSFQDSSGFDDPAVDTSELIYTFELLGIDPASWQTGGKSALDYMQNLAMNEDKTFGSGKNIASNTWVLDAYLQLGAGIGSDTALGLSLNPSAVSLAVNGAQQLSATNFGLNGISNDVSTATTWSVDDPATASVQNGLVTGLQAGQTAVHAVYNELTASVPVSVHSSGGDDTPGHDEGISVNVSVIGKNSTKLFAAATLSLLSSGSYGYTALGALDATGLSWSFSSQFPDFVIEIAGLANQGLNGWMYKVNGLAPSVAAGDYTLAEGDSVIWWYSTSSSGGSGGGTGSIAAITTVTGNSDFMQEISFYQTELDKMVNGSNLVNSSSRMSAADILALKGELEKNLVQITEETELTDTLITDTLGEVALLVPEKALAVKKTLTIEEVPSNTLTQPYAVQVSSPIYQFGPNGTSFDKPVIISLKVAIAEDMDVNNLTPAWYDEQSQQWVAIPGVIDLSKGRVVFAVDHFTDFALISLPPRISFDDVNEDFAWAKDAVEILAGKGIICGTGQGFEPQKHISRAEFAHLLVKAQNLSQEPGIPVVFSDVCSSDWFAADISTAYKHKLISGYTDGTFKPLEIISRSEMAIILYRMTQETNLSDVSLSYQDAGEIPAWALDGVKFASKYGLMRIDEGGSFEGVSPVSRAEAAVAVFRYLNSPLLR